MGTMSYTLQRRDLFMSQSLDQEIRTFFEHAKLFALSRDEVMAKSAAWQKTHGAEEVNDLMMAIDPMGQVFQYPKPSEQDLKTKLTSIFEQAKFFSLSESEVQSNIFDLVGFGYTADSIVAMMAVVDPERLVFDHPIGPNEKGIHGLELWQNRYEDFSDTYGHNIRHSEHISPEFVEACEQLWEEGVLYDHGGLSVDIKTRLGGYTVVVGIEPHLKPVQADLEALKDKHGLHFECIAMKLRHDPKAFGASVVLATLITDRRDLQRVPGLASEMQDVADKWQKRFEKKQSSESEFGF